MAVLRDIPYGNFNFLVDLGDGNTEGAQAGFSEVSGLSMTVEVIEYRLGNMAESGAMKIPGRAHYGDVTLKRGIIGSLNLFQWIDQVRNGDIAARRTVTISLLSEDRTAPVTTWKLRRAWPVRFAAAPLVAASREIAIEELVLAHERLELE
ncbi:phage tail protein [Sphingomonas sanxanigenens]|uniref:Phage tail protein n=1 Tax=Sphingomonas sanxanigenens DSM 19645 = NX02 TaxID=1123269 RepID=W0A7S4_9SPHN|nr:phage tail protein [Sphingomonas sanxanigenens]AHE52512.1 hypothetical protein NX02_03790 [Sphingomonas sanxanigenens DSM 19645 = NX02]